MSSSSRLRTPRRKPPTSTTRERASAGNQRGNSWFRTPRATAARLNETSTKPSECSRWRRTHTVSRHHATEARERCCRRVRGALISPETTERHPSQRGVHLIPPGSADLRCAPRTHLIGTNHDRLAAALPDSCAHREDWPAVLEVDGNAFGGTLEAEVNDGERLLQEPGRSLGAFDGASLVGLTSAFSFDLTVPGAVVPAAGVSWVGVLPTHRRRGVLRGLMTSQLHDVRERGREAVAILWASEPVIYGRFGYGLASHAYAMKVPRNPHALRADAPSDPALRLGWSPRRTGS